MNILQGINLYLIGMMGAGKTTVGHLLAQNLKYGFVDTDDVIVKAAGRTINQIFEQAGEPCFRQLETDVLAQVSAFTKLCVATGGGIILKRENWSYLHYGLIVWLDVPVELLYLRLSEDTSRPLLQQTNLKTKLVNIIEQRKQLYALADLRIPVSEGETPAQIATRILREIPSVLKSVNSDQ